MDGNETCGFRRLRGSVAEPTRSDHQIWTFDGRVKISACYEDVHLPVAMFQSLPATRRDSTRRTDPKKFLNSSTELPYIPCLLCTGISIGCRLPCQASSYSASWEISKTSWNRMFIIEYKTVRPFIYPGPTESIAITIYFIPTNKTLFPARALLYWLHVTAYKCASFIQLLVTIAVSCT
jgi:hypothetical protein